MDKREFTRRVQARQDVLYRIACTLLHEEQDRLDTVQEAVLKAWANIDKLRRSEYFETWLTRIFINCCHDLQKRQSRSVPLEAAPEPSGWCDMDSSLRDAVLALPEDLRLPLTLYYMEGYKLREVAAILKRPESTVKARLRSAKRKLRELLEEKA